MVKALDDTLTQEQLDILRLLVKHNGFQLYLGLLQSKFDKEYKRLRKVSRDKTYDKLNGFLDGLEWSINVVDYTIQESHNPEKDGEGE